jgi:predicted Zn-dependent protease
MVYESIVSYVIFFSVTAFIAGLMDMTDEPRTTVVRTSVSAYVIETAVLLILIPAWLYGAYLPSRKMEEFQRVADMPSDMRAPAYDHLFHSNGSYTINTDSEFFTSPLFYSYDAQKVQLKANPTYQKYASAEVDSILIAVDPIWQRTPYDYHLSLSLVQLENLEFYLSGGATHLTKADQYAKRAFALSPTDPQIYFAYAQTLVYENNIAQAKVLLDRAIALNANYHAASEFRKLLK